MSEQKDIITEMGKRFHARYSKSFVDFNKKIIISLDEFGGFSVPDVSLDEGGFCEVIGDGELPTITALDTEKNVARPKIKTTRFKPIKTRYVVRIPWSTIEETHNNIEYFEQYFDKIVQNAVTNYFKRYGDPNVVRYGEVFINYVSPKGEVFRYDGSGDHLDLVFEGKWASNERA